MMLRSQDDVVWPMSPAIRHTMLRVQAAKTRRRAWAWWFTACALFTAAVIAEQEWRAVLALLTVGPLANALHLFATAQDLLDDSMEDDL